MMVPETQLLELDGTIRKISGHRSLILNDPEKMWVIIEGEGELVSTDILDSHATGRRHFIGTAQPGEILFSIQGDNSTTNHAVMLLSQENLRVIELPKEHLGYVSSSISTP